MSITAILNVHDEGRLAEPSFNSAMQSIDDARRSGIDANLMVILDCPDQMTRSVIDRLVRSAEESQKVVSHGDLSQSRNAGVELVDSRYVAFLDGDDLWCVDWLQKSYRFAEQESEQSICHPEWNVTFGASNMHFQHADQMDRRFSLNALRCINYWTALSFARTETYLRFPYRANRISEGIGFEDWAWNCETIRNGFVHRVVPETTHFIRYKESGSLRSLSFDRRCVRDPSGFLPPLGQRNVIETVAEEPNA